MGNAASSTERRPAAEEAGSSSSSRSTRRDLLVVDTEAERSHSRKRKRDDLSLDHHQNADNNNNNNKSGESWSLLSPPTKIARAAVVFGKWSFQEAVELVAPPPSSRQQLHTNLEEGRTLSTTTTTTATAAAANNNIQERKQKASEETTQDAGNKEASRDNLIGRLFKLPKFHRRSNDGPQGEIHSLNNNNNNNISNKKKNTKNERTSGKVEIRRSTMMQPHEYNVAVCANIGRKLADAQRCPLCNSSDLTCHRLSCPLSRSIKRYSRGEKGSTSRSRHGKESKRSKSRTTNASKSDSQGIIADRVTLSSTSADPSAHTLTYATVRALLQNNNNEDSMEKRIVSGSVAPLPVEILMNHAIAKSPEFGMDNMKPTIKKNSQNNERLAWFKANFSEYSFLCRCPKQVIRNCDRDHRNRSNKDDDGFPCPLCCIASESKIALVRWDLQGHPKIDVSNSLSSSSSSLLNCPNCEDGSTKYVCDRFEKITPVFDTIGKPIFVASFVFKCPKCKHQESGCSPYFLARLPLGIQQRYPCPAHWIKPGCRFQVTHKLASTIQETMQNNPVQGAMRVEVFLNTKYAGLYAMEQASYLVACGGSPKVDFPSFEEWFGHMNIPTAAEIEDLYMFAMGSCTSRLW